MRRIIATKICKRSWSTRAAKPSSGIARRAFAAQDHGRLAEAASELEAALRYEEHALTRERTALRIVERAKAEREAVAAEIAGHEAERDGIYDAAVEHARAAQRHAPSDARRRRIERLEQRAFNELRRLSEYAYDLAEYGAAIHYIEQARKYGSSSIALQLELHEARYQRVVQLGERAERSRDLKAACATRQTEADARRAAGVRTDPARAWGELRRACSKREMRSASGWVLRRA